MDKHIKKGIIDEPDPTFPFGKRPVPGPEPIGFPGNDTPTLEDIQKAQGKIPAGPILGPDCVCSRCGGSDLYFVGEFLVCAGCGAVEKTE